VTLRVPASLRLTVPLILLGFAATLSAFNFLYHVPRAERAAEQESRKRLAQEMSRLQSTLEYLLLKGDQAVAQHEIAVLAHNHDYLYVCLTDDQGSVIATTAAPGWAARSPRRWPSSIPARRRGRSANAMPGSSTTWATTRCSGYAGILMGREREQLRRRAPAACCSPTISSARKPRRARSPAAVALLGALGDRARPRDVAAGHFLLTRRTARLVRAAEELAAGDLSARSDLGGEDELGRLSRAFDAMAIRVAETQTRLQQDIAERARVQQALETSAEEYRSMFNASIDGLALWNAEAEMVDANPALWRMYGYSEESASLDAEPARRPVLPARCPALHRFREAGPRRHHRDAQGRLEPRDRGPRHPDAVPGKSARPDHRARRHRREALGGGARAAARSAVPAREAGALGSLLAGVAHELNNPLSVVVARAVMLEEKGDPATRAAAVKIRAAADRCARIVRTFLAMARQQRPERGRVAINDVVTAALDITAYAVRTSGIEVALDLAAVPPIHADADQLHQVLLNLVINAQHALQDHPDRAASA
jgi:two-component system NtrC family sensor kinase